MCFLYLCLLLKVEDGGAEEKEGGSGVNPNDCLLPRASRGLLMTLMEHASPSARLGPIMLGSAMVASVVVVAAEVVVVFMFEKVEAPMQMSLLLFSSSGREGDEISQSSLLPLLSISICTSWS